MSKQDKKCLLESLPSELLLMIINYLEDYMDLLNLGSLSESFSSLVQQSYYHTEKLTFDGCKANSLDLETIEPILRKAPRLKSLKLTNRDGSNVIRRIGPDAHFIFTDNCPELTDLDVSGVSIAPSELISILKKSNKLTTLTISNSKFDDENELDKTTAIISRSVSLVNYSTNYRRRRRYNNNIDQYFDDDYDDYFDENNYDVSRLIDLRLVEDLKSEEEIKLAEKISFYEDWLNNDLKECKQEVSEIEWSRVTEEIHDRSYTNYVAKLNLSTIDQLYAQNIETFTEFELSEMDEHGKTKWSARGWPYRNRLYKNTLFIEIKNVGGKNHHWHHIERMPQKGAFMLTNANIRQSHERKIKCIKNGLKRISTDYLLRSVIVADENGFPNFESMNTLRSVSVDHTSRKYEDVQLDESQIEAINTALCKRISLIMGPPGTGKTLTSSVMAYELFKTRSCSNSKILICASSNVAVDIIADKIHESAKLSIVRISSEYNIRRNQGMSKRYYLNKRLDDRIGIAGYNVSELEEELYDLRDLHGPFHRYGSLLIRSKLKQLDYHGRQELKESKKECEKNIIDSCQVILTTCNGIPRLIDYGTYLFDSIIVDECSQVSVPDSLLLLQFLPRRIVLVGDDNQLGPVIKDTLKNKYNCSNTVLYNKLKGVGFRPSMLNVQYRMHPEIAKFPNEHFYLGMIKNGIMASDRQWEYRHITCPFPKQDRPIYFHCHSFEESHKPGSTSCLNLGEIEIVINTIEVLLSRGVEKNEIGVITPYKDQSDLIVDKLKPRDEEGKLLKQDKKDPDDFIEVDTVDAYQGRDKNYIIVSLVRSRNCSGFVSDRRRLNVTLTRAKYGLIIIGNALTLVDNPMLGLLIRDCSSRSLLYSEILSEKSRPVTLDELLLRDHYISKAVSSLLRDLLNKVRSA